MYVIDPEMTKCFICHRKLNLGLFEEYNIGPIQYGKRHIGCEMTKMRGERYYSTKIPKIDDQEYTYDTLDEEVYDRYHKYFNSKFGYLWKNNNNWYYWDYKNNKWVIWDDEYDIYAETPENNTVIRLVGSSIHFVIKIQRFWRKYCLKREIDRRIKNKKKLKI